MKRIVIMLAAVAVVGSAAAQEGSMGGLLMDKDLLMPADIFSL